MDKGAHFHACDFQVHSPRDPQWHGNGATTPAERRIYATEFVAACRQKGLDAVAITDHHDMAFVPYVREAVAEEKDAAGTLLPPDHRLIVFPGMELTLGVPCQALLLFDSAFPQDLFPLVRTALAISQASDSDDKCLQAVRLETITTLSQLHRELDKHEYLRGHYIVLPNVSEGGTSTLLRSGHQGHYKEMPCVGGYLDGPISQLGDGNHGILGGMNSQYGHKVLGLFQTSDNRRRDFADLGKHVTWVKWATPTAEALRQACLARESRISQVAAQVPSVFIRSISVSNSRFLGPLVLEFNPQYNAIIGGRGTGKSTILEYARWALCDDAPPAQDDTEETTDYQAKRRRLIERTLVSLGANVQVTFSLHGVPHVVRRSAANGELLLKIGNGAFEPCSEGDVRRLLPIQGYSQKQLSSVAIRLEELTRFVHAPVRQSLDELSRRFDDIANQLRTEYHRLLRARAAQRELELLDREVRSQAEQVQQLRTGMQGVSPEDEQTIRLRAAYDDEEQIIGAWLEDVRRAQSAVAVLQRTIEGMPTSPNQRMDSLPGDATLRDITEGFAALFRRATVATHDLLRELASSTEPATSLGASLESWRSSHDAFELKYQTSKMRSTANEHTLSQLTELESRGRYLRDRATTVRAEIPPGDGAGSTYGALRDQWRSLHDERARLLEEQCEQLTLASDSQIRAQLKRCAAIDAVSDRFKAIVSGANIRATKVEKLCEHITRSEAPIDKWYLTLDELECLIALDDTAALPATPILMAAGFTQADIRKIASKLTADGWLDLSLVVLEDTPVFEYRSREAEYIPFAEASAGQQATALLWALLNQDGAPLIIDQPEDDLDNQVMLQVVEQIWKAKTRRQLVFSSHNANLVVNGDAELVVCCDYRVTGEQSSGVVKYEGAIDVDDIRAEVATVMEGGKAAFKLRRDKYGF